MYKLVIADDELNIREGLRNAADWEQLGFEIIGVFSDGAEVLEMLDYLIPDVILTDIKMGSVSGIQIAKYVQQNKLPCKVVLLSGYQEFQLAVDAVRYDVEEYLLKPTDIGELQRVFSGLFQKLTMEEQDNRIKARNRETLENSKKLLDEFFWSNFIFGAIDSREYIIQCLELLLPNIDPFSCQCTLAEVEIEQFEAFLQDTWEYGQDQFCEYLHEYIQLYKSHVVFRIVYMIDNRFTLLAVDGSCSAHELLDALAGLMSSIESTFHLHLTFEPQQCRQDILSLKDNPQNGDSSNRDSFVLPNLQEQKNLIISNLAIGNILNAQKIFHSVLSAFGADSVNEKRETIFEIISTMETFLKEITPSLAESLHQILANNRPTVQQDPEKVEEWADRIFDRLKQEYFFADNACSSIVEQAKAYIQENIFTDLSQEATAEHLYISSSYLSRLFRKNSGESYIQYVTRVKMEKAIELLQDPQYRIYQISELLGYRTPRYFTRLFQSFTGVYPSDYRRKVLHIDECLDENHSTDS